MKRSSLALLVLTIVAIFLFAFTGCRNKYSGPNMGSTVSATISKVTSESRQLTSQAGGTVSGIVSGGNQMGSKVISTASR